ncbi:DUF6745 domain-containing protein [Actinoplanes sp. CA-015351]|uniref:DUF6745 domain-containing protein n=1 Tax=Actinoplanes sp. CA-015351 TaxID=3239897 RepID=UPI003D97DC5F
MGLDTGGVKPRAQLAAGQEAKLMGAASLWLRTERLNHTVDRPAAKAALTKMYGLLEVPMPPVVWVDSPGAATELLRDAGDTVPAPKLKQHGDRHIPGLDPMPGSPWLIQGLSWNLGEEVAESTLRLAARAMGLHLERGYGPPVESGDSYAVLAPLAQSIGQTVFQDRSVRLGYDAWLNAYWVRFYDAIGQAGLIEYWPAMQERLDVLVALAKSGAGWWWPFEDRCVVSLRPIQMAAEYIEWLDSPGVHEPAARLHCADGPALTFLDGWTRYAWRGVPVPESLIEEGWSAERLLDEDDGGPELRRSAIERLGWPAFLDATGLRPRTPPVPDPFRPGGTLALYDVPSALTRRVGNVRVLVWSKRGRRFGKEVYSLAEDPVKAAIMETGLHGPRAAEYLNSRT